MTDETKTNPTWVRRLGRICLEIGSIVFAVMIALIADQWREDQERSEQAAIALSKVIEEVAENLSELEGSLRKNAVLAEHLAIMSNEDADGALSVQMELSLVSDAAWESAKMTQTLHHIEFGRITELARYYNQLAFFLMRQDAMLTLIGGIQQSDSKRDAAGSLAGQLRILLSMQEILIQSSRDLLNESQVARRGDEAS